jgi:Rps23 Pro-64 3,4-dihydroxylase Tpa1-like proline 4-hydroxylase
MNHSLVQKPFCMPEAMCRAAEAVWPDESWPYWHRYCNETSNKFASMDRGRIPPACLAVLELCAQTLTPCMPKGSFIDYDFHAAGMHMLPPGGFVRAHYDAERHPIRHWKRVFSAVVFINSDWQPEYGGALQLDAGVNKIHEVVPEHGLVAFFETAGQLHAVSPTAASAPYRKTLCLFGWEQCSGAELDSHSDRSQFVNR